MDWKIAKILVGKMNCFVFVLYVGITLILFYPLVLNISTHVGYAGDHSASLTSFWWIRHAVIDLHKNPAISDYHSYPYQNNIFFHNSPFVEFLSIPFQLIFGTIITLNLFVLFSYALSGYFAYLLAYHLTKNKYGSFIAGIIYAFSTLHLFDNLCNTSAIYFLPLYALALFRLKEGPTFKNFSLTLFSLVGLLLSNFYYVVYLAFFFFTIYFIYLLLTKQVSKGLIRYLIISHFLAIMVSAPIYLNPYLRTAPSAKEWMQNLGIQTTMLNPTELFGYFFPSQYNPLFGHIKLKYGSYQEGSPYLGLITLLLVWYSIRKIKFNGKGFWVLLSITAFLFSLGPFLAFNSKVSLPRILLPYYLFTKIPVLNFLRAPGRIFYLISLSFGVLSAFAIRTILSNFSYKAKSVFISLISTTILLENIYIFPFPIQSVGVPDYYKSLREDRESYGIIQLPPGGFNLVKYQYFSVISGKKTVSPLEPRPSEASLRFTNNTPFLYQLYRPDILYNKKIKELDVLTFRESVGILAKENIRKIILHKKVYLDYISPDSKNKYPYMFRTETQSHSYYLKYLDYLTKILGNPSYEDREVTVFELPKVDDFDFVVKLTDGWFPGIVEYLQNKYAVRAIAEQASLEIFSRKKAIVRLNLGVKSYLGNEMLKVVKDGNIIDVFRVAGPDIQDFSTKDIILEAGENRIFLQTSGYPRNRGFYLGFSKIRIAHIAHKNIVEERNM